MPTADHPPQPALLEREAEIAAIHGLAAAARGGTGRLLVIEGRSGIGKTRLVAEVRGAAQAAGLEVLAARAGELEQEFAFGVVRQLFEPLLVAVATRPPEHSPQAALLTEVLTDPAAELLRPRPLGTAAVAVLARHTFGGEPDPEFVSACQTATGGNPLFVRAMLEALTAEGLAATAAVAAQVLRTGPDTIARTVSLRLARLPAEATALLRAATVLGDGSRLRQAGELAGLEVDAAARAATALVRADLLRAGDPIEFP